MKKKKKKKREIEAGWRKDGQPIKRKLSLVNKKNDAKNWNKENKDSKSEEWDNQLPGGKSNAEFSSTFIHVQSL